MCVAAGVSPVVSRASCPAEQGHACLKASGYLQIAEQPGVPSRRQDADLYGSQDDRRYAKRATELISRGFFASADVIE